MNRLTRGELIFKISAYTLIGIFALLSLYPVVYAFSASISGPDAMMQGKVILLPVDLQFIAYKDLLKDKEFWTSYSNTLFYTFFGTIWSMIISTTGAYSLSRKRLLFRRKFNFFIVFSMWFTAGMIPSYINYKSLGVDNRWGVIVAFGVQAYNIVLLRNYFSGVPSEVEEAARIDGANEFQIFMRIYLPMSKAALATVTLFYAVSRWNAYFWASLLLKGNEQGLQVYMRQKWEQLDNLISENPAMLQNYTPDTLMYAIIICSVIPVIIIYPLIQKYFAAGVNLGGVKG